MKTAAEAEVMARAAMSGYVAACGCDTLEDVSNVLMKLVSMCGLGMCAAGGREDAVARLQGTAAYIAKTQEGVHWRAERAN